MASNHPKIMFRIHSGKVTNSMEIPPFCRCISYLEKVDFHCYQGTCSGILVDLPGVKAQLLYLDVMDVR